MHVILISIVVLFVAAVSIMGLAAGNVLAAIFVSIPLCGFIFLRFALGGPGANAWALGSLIALAVIWTRVIRVYNRADLGRVEQPPLLLRRLD